MKQLTFKWLKRLWAFIAVKLIIIAVLVTAARVGIVTVNQYQAQLIDWVASEHNINVTVDKISAGIDFSGLVLTLNNVDFVDTDVLPFELKLDYLFLHLDFINSIKQKEIIFTDISLKGAALVVKPLIQSNQADVSQSQITLNSLKNIFLQQLSSFSITDSQVTFTDRVNQEKTIYVQDLSWINDGERHQGVGKASLPDTFGRNTVEFVINIDGHADAENKDLQGNIYAHSAKLDLREYLRPQVNPLAELTTADIAFKFWGDFDFTGPKNMQLHWEDSTIAWNMLAQSHHWNIKEGAFQVTYDQKKWYFDSFDFKVKHNFILREDLKLSGQGVFGEISEFDLNGINIHAVLPFGLLFSDATDAQIKHVNEFEMGGEVSYVGVESDPTGELAVSVKIDAFNNQPVGAIPGITEANITFVGNQKEGVANVTLPAQHIYFDGQFSRPMPVKEGDIDLGWRADENGFELFSDKTVLITDDLNTVTQFSLLLPSEAAADSSPFLSLYAYASLNDAEQAQYYYPITAMGDNVFNYLQPTLKKGTVDGAKILWYGSFSDYPYAQNTGVFQAWVPVRDAQYDFYGDWEGLTELDLDLLFENDYLLMESQSAKLGGISIDKLSGKVDKLDPNGVLTITAEIEDNAKPITQYLVASPLKDSVGTALEMIRIENEVSGQLVIAIPFNTEKDEPQTTGTISLTNNAIDIELASDFILPLKNVQGDFSFVDGNLKSNDINATLFSQPIDFSFITEQQSEHYKVNASLFGQWDIDKVNQHIGGKIPPQLQGMLDWQGKVNFTQNFAGGYDFEVNLMSDLQGVNTSFPAPLEKHALQTWPSKIDVLGDQLHTKWYAKLSDKMTSYGELRYHNNASKLPYLFVGLGKVQGHEPDYTKQIVQISEDSLDMSEWLRTFIDWQAATEETAEAGSSLVNIDDIYVNIGASELFEQPINNIKAHLTRHEKQWGINVFADNLIADIKYHKGTPDRYDINIDKLDFQLFNIDALSSDFSHDAAATPQDDLLTRYPEIYLECQECVFKKMQLSPLSMHVFPNQSSYTIEHFRLGSDEEFINISGMWDQHRTYSIIEAQANSDNSIVQRLGYSSPMVYEEAGMNGSLNWVGAPWAFNLETLNGEVSIEAKDGYITEVDDKGARLLSFLSLDGVRRSLNLEFDNVFSKGLGFDDMSLSAEIVEGIFESDDYFLDGSAGKITGQGLVDLPNLDVNYRFSYSPAVTSSLPVLAAFAINPLTGAAVLMLTKILEPVVDTIIRVDFSVIGPLDDPVITIENSQREKIKLQNSDVLEEMSDTDGLKNGANDAL